MVFVARVLVDAVSGQRVLFYERPTLGGETTLRAFGQSRFIDDTLLLVNLEERILIKEKEIFHYLVDFEVAPFVECGAGGVSFQFQRAGSDPSQESASVCWRVHTWWAGWTLPLGTTGPTSLLASIIRFEAEAG